MQVNLITRPELDVRGVPPPPGVRRPPPQDQVQFRGTEAVNSALESTPAVRSEEVSRVQSTLQTVPYPPTEIIQRISRLLANNWIAPAE